MRCSVCFLLSLACLGVAVETSAGELTSPKGFTITYPDGWTPATQAQLDAIGKITKTTPAAMIYGLQREKFADNLGVAVVPAVMPVDKKSVTTFADTLKKQLGAAGLKVSNFKSRQIQVAGKKAISVAFENDMPGVNEPLRQWQLYVPGKSQTYVFTCTSLKSRWADEWPGFKDIVKNLRIDVAP